MEVRVTNRRESHIWTQDHDLLIKESEDLVHVFDRIEDVEVIVDEVRHDHHPVCEVEILVNCEHKHSIVGKGHSKNRDIAPAFHDALHKIKRQLHEYKEKIQRHR